MPLTLSVTSRKPQELVEITAEVARAVGAAGLREGVCHLFVAHTTAGITINENADPDVARDLLGALERMVPTHHPDYRHAEGNSHAHLKASLMGNHALVPVHQGRLVLGTWQGIYLCEFDGPRTRRVVVTLLPA